MQGQSPTDWGLNNRRIVPAGFPVAQVVKNPPASATDTSPIPGWGRCPEKGEANPHHPSTLAWRIPWTEEPGGLYSMGSQRPFYTETKEIFDYPIRVSGTILTCET